MFAALSEGREVKVPIAPLDRLLRLDVGIYDLSINWELVKGILA
jgi:hypothetical protein